MLEKLGRFQITDEIGRGAAGVVYRALDTNSGEEVALKVLPATGFGPASDKTMIERLRREAESTSILKHPNIVHVHGLEEEGEQVYLVMELVRGYTLEDALRNAEAMAPPDVARIISATADALDFAHRSGMVHRDVKPANLMVTHEGDVKVMDFGAVKMLDREQAQNLTRIGTTIGSPHYMSPEQVLGKAVDGRSDQFSLAVIAYQLLSGQKPFAAESLAAVLYQIADQNHEPVTSIKTDLPLAVEPVFERALSKTRDHRYASCAEFAAELSAALLAGGGVVAVEEVVVEEVAMEETPTEELPAEGTVSHEETVPAEEEVAAEGAGETHEEVPVAASVVQELQSAPAPVKSTPWLLIGVAVIVAIVVIVLLMMRGR